MWSDFTGFTFDGVHSDELNILRVSDGDRYNEEILPEIEDKTVEAEGKDGVYYYGSFYKSRNIEIQIAFDKVTEEQYRNIRRLFGQKKVCKLIFDERPYKVFYAKVADPITLETICFDEDDYYWESDPHEGYIPGGIDHKIYTGKKRRIYNDDGSIKIVCYNLFARQLYKTLDMYPVNGYDNVDEWSASSGILGADVYRAAAIDVYQDISDQSSIKFSDEYNGQFNVNNPGDIDTPYYLFIPYVGNRIEPNKNEDVVISTDGFPEMLIEPFDNEGGDYENGIIINTRAELIEGVHYDYTLKAWRITGNIYNRHIKEGHFGRIFKGDKFDFRHQGIYLNCKTNDVEESIEIPAIFYNYLYY